MKKIIKYLPFLVLGIVFYLIYRNWFKLDLVSGGDFFFLPFREQSLDRPAFPFSWDTHKNFGLGGSSVSTLWVDTYSQIFVNFLVQNNISLVLIQKIIFFFPIILFSFLSPYIFFKTLYPQSKVGRFLAIIIYSLNTYLLMIVGGGQTGIALAYLMSSLIFAVVIKNMEKNTKSGFIISGILFALSIFFDLRIFLLILLLLFIYLIYLSSFDLIKIGKTFLLPLLISVGIHFYWLLPLFYIKETPFTSGYSNSNWLDYLSFPDFSHSFSLLQPNWPENIFGKTYFMRPEFLFLPFLAFASLIFLKKDKNIIFFTMLGLIGALLAKGTKPPFGEIYRFLYDYLPGFSLFRDPTKFYLLTALSYAVLIPLTVEQIYLLINKKIRNSQFAIKKFKYIKFLPNLFLSFVACYLFLLIKPAWTGNLTGIYKSAVIPEEYVELKKLLSKDSQFFRTMWVPQEQRFGFFSDTHPAIDARYYFQTGSSSKIINKIKYNREELRNLSLKYLIVPYDSEKEIFLTDRQFDNIKRIIVKQGLEKIPWLKKISTFTNLVVFENRDYFEHIRLSNINSFLVYQKINPVKYKITINNKIKNNKLIFSESYSPNWVLIINNQVIPSVKGEYSLNNFIIKEKGIWSGTLEYVLQKYVDYGLVVTLITIIIIIAVILIKKI